MKRMLVVLSVLAFSVPVYALQCGGEAVQVGESKIDVLLSCGVPDYEILVEKVETRVDPNTVTVQDVVRWVYLNPSLQEVTVLEFRGDFVIHIEWRRK